MLLKAERLLTGGVESAVEEPARLSLAGLLTAVYKWKSKHPRKSPTCWKIFSPEG